MKTAIIGCGAIGQRLCELVPQLVPEVGLAVVAERQEAHAALRERLDSRVLLVSSPDALIEAGVTLAIECAGHAALRGYGPTLLRRGIDLMVVSVGALADAPTETLLHRAAVDGGSKIRIPSGAAGGLDVLTSARLAGLESVAYRCVKPPAAWQGTPAQTMVALESLSESTVFYSASAREAARLFPQNANFAASVALAGVGFDNTTVELCADPKATRNTHSVHAKGVFGDIAFQINGISLATNAKTSLLTPYSVVRMLMNLCRPVALA
ncbi:aspartate dehydrogenase [Variovorax sp. YR634]|uniref:aspartate dehydrogenase n=1 Tax=Variovorax sp. YR634 TaxID=1884385 RepID=UPI0008988F1A|nr:aspartate dehydrogenase [Variovorax sp. YR634]SDZ45138.1 aspartate dehydrogenase [Variovorax sp. YR634]